jgi:phosphoribosylformylglycinamidine synthase
MPIAHGEGRYFADEKTLDQLESSGQVIYRYCDANGNIHDEANPNGSARNIAGICNEGRNVFGMMPHPERACTVALGNIDGRQVFQNLFIQNEPSVARQESGVLNF